MLLYPHKIKFHQNLQVKIWVVFLFQVTLIDPKMIISGIGERPAIDHMEHFGVVGFTSGSVCIAPYLSTMLLRAMQRGDSAVASKFREFFMGSV